MDDIASQILHGCKLAGELEANLPNLLNQSQHNLLKESCDQVVQTFNKAIRQLTTGKADRSSGHGFIGMERTFDLVPARATIGREEAPLAPPEKPMGSPDASQSVEMIKPLWIGPASAIQRGEEPSTDAAVMLIGSSGESSFGVASMTSNKTKSKTMKRLTPKEWERKIRNVRRILVQGVEQGEMPPDDGYTWRKYGQKEILGAKFPRGYYRCTHHKHYGCPAKKKVQRLQEDPLKMEVVYGGVHTCGSSFIMGAPASVDTWSSFIMPGDTPPTNLEHNQQSQSQSISIQLGTWSSGEVQCSATNADVYSKDKAGKEAIVMCGSDSSGGSVHISPRTQATKEKDETTHMAIFGD